MIPVLRKAAIATALWMGCGVAAATGLQVSPISLNLQPSANAEGLWLSNTGDALLHAQVRVYQWTQEGGEDRLTPSRGLVISPPMLQLAVGARQMVRVIRVGAPPIGADAVESAYRIVVDELPVDVKGGKGLSFVMRYSVPVFVEPAGKTSVAPQLQWTLHAEGKQAVLEVSNSGDGHAQLARLGYTDRNGRRTDINDGLLGYVLPHSTMRWVLKPPASVFVGGGTLEARINDAPVTQALSLADAPH